MSEKKPSTAPHVYTAIAAVQQRLAVEGIAKDRQNQQQGFKYRGIDDVYGALAPCLAEHGLCILPRVLKREVTERQTQRGGTLFSVILDVEFDLVSAVDGTRHTVRVCGEAMDSGDKATNKAMSAAYKYMALMTFAIPTEGEDNDADATTHDVAARPAQPPPTAPRPLSPAVQAIVAWLGEEPDLECLNSGRTAEEMGNITDPDDKRRAWKLITNYARNQGWEFNGQSKRFANQPQPIGAA